MSRIMLIDAAHPEETRVAVVNSGEIEDFDFEAADHRQLRGNIYLAKVTRVEPSLQAAFVEYGGNRHGFLAFSEIHPDYYQIPAEDREALLEEAQSADGEDGDDVDEDELAAENARRTARFAKRYPIQQVIRRRQVMLVQVVKEERGTKGAALTTYLSLAGRYCVLMPNTARGGGISRKITSASDRKRLKSIVSDLSVPQGMGLIIRTAGASRTKTEIKRDYEYLLRMWENIRQQTLESVAPTLIHQEGGLVERSIRDLYDKDVDNVFVEGDTAYREAKDFMKLLIPSHAKKVKEYKDVVPLFTAHGVEQKMESVFSVEAPLKSGGYLVIHQTEALVAIDVNSGRATRERNIESTALKTNLEAAVEAARQMRLRDLAGLVVIDFIDMEDNKNNRAVERKMKDALKLDRARIQMGKISSFGLMELSRQRRRQGVMDSSFETCPHCLGLGKVRSVRSAALAALRELQMKARTVEGGVATLEVSTDVALYLLNDKRDAITQLETAMNAQIIISARTDLKSGEHALSFEGETRKPDPEPTPAEKAAKKSKSGGASKKRSAEDAAASLEVVEVDDDEADDAADAEAAGDDEKPSGRRRRKRGRRGGSRRRKDAAASEAQETDATDGDDKVDGADRGDEPTGNGPASSAPTEDAGSDASHSSDEPPAEPQPLTDYMAAAAQAALGAANGSEDEGSATNAAVDGDEAAAETPEKPKRKRRSRRKPKVDATTEAAAEGEQAVETATTQDKGAVDPTKSETAAPETTQDDVTEAPSTVEVGPSQEPMDAVEAVLPATDDVTETATEDPPPVEAGNANDQNSEPVLETVTVDAPIHEAAPAAPIDEEPVQIEEPVSGEPTLDGPEVEKPKRGWWSLKRR